MIYFVLFIPKENGHLNIKAEMTIDMLDWKD